MKNTIKHLFFDLDHTLWDFEKNSELTFDFVLKKHQISISTSQFMLFYVPTNAKYWELYRNDEISQLELRYGRFQETFKLLDYTITDDLINLISEDYIYLLPTFTHLFPGTIEVLDYLKLHYELHIITNGFDQVQDKKMLNSGIKSYFKTITNSEKAGAKKPSPIIFNHALTTANATKNESVMIGDCIDADVNGAINFGMKAIYFNPNNTKVIQNINQISTLAELKDFF